MPLDEHIQPAAAAPTDRFIHESGLAAEIARLAEPVITELGCRLVRVRIIATAGQTVQIMADKPPGIITVEDCARISRRLSPVLDVADAVPGSYLLEVSSPGIDRPLVRPSDFEDWAGFEAKVELSQPIDGRRRFKGEIEGFEDGEARLRMPVAGFAEAQIVGLPVALIAEAKLVLTDELIRASLSAAKQQLEGVGEGGEMDLDHADPDTEIELEDEDTDGANGHGRSRQ